MEREGFSTAAQNQMMMNKNKQKRFSDEQIRSLESMFESRTKLEPRMKMEIATELGLQPRQVAIWFQNRRARWKSKQIEQDYKMLKLNYDNLHSQFETLKMEKQSLHIELQDLSNMLEKGCSRVANTANLNEDQPYGGCHGGDGVQKLRNEPIGCSNQGLVEAGSDGNAIENGPKFEQQEEETHTMNCEEYDSEELQDMWTNVHSSGLLDESCGNVHWWDYWT